MASPKPKPAALKLLNGRGNGTDSGGRKVAPGPAFARLPPQAPAFLDGPALEEWNRVVPELQRLQLLKPGDGPTLVAYCLAWGRLVGAQEIIAAEGLLSFNSQGRVKHPAVVVVEAASKELRALAAEFGLTPSSEQRLAQGAKNGDGEDDNPFA
ncbi:MAG: phage terminase small subunit P27 family [Terricaulis sp.]